MYLEFFGLKEKPFSITPDLDFLYLGKAQEQALGTLLYGVREKLGFGLLTGEVGAGKTTLSRALLNRLDPNVATALLVNPLLSVPELLQAVAKDFGLDIRSQSPQELLEALDIFLLNRAEEGKTALLIIDEAQNLSFESFEVVRMLTNLETDKHKLVQIILIGQPELLKKLASHDLRQLNQRITTRVHLKPLMLVDMMRYINHRVSIAGGSGKVFFDPKAYKMIYRESKGFPRVINLLCERALMAAYVKESYVVNREAVQSAVKDWLGAQPTTWWDKLKRLVA